MEKRTSLRGLRSLRSSGQAEWRWGVRLAEMGWSGAPLRQAVRGTLAEACLLGGRPRKAAPTEANPRAQSLRGSG